MEREEEAEHFLLRESFRQAAEEAGWKTRKAAIRAKHPAAPRCLAITVADGIRRPVPDGMLYASKLSTRFERHCLLLKHQGRPTDSLPLKVDSYLDTIGDLDEGNAFIHPVILSIKCHRPFNLT